MFGGLLLLLLVVLCSTCPLWMIIHALLGFFHLLESWMLSLFSLVSKRMLRIFCLRSNLSRRTEEVNLLTNLYLFSFRTMASCTVSVVPIQQNRMGWLKGNIATLYPWVDVFFTQLACLITTGLMLFPLHAL